MQGGTSSSQQARSYLLRLRRAATLQPGADLALGEQPATHRLCQLARRRRMRTIYSRFYRMLPGSL